MCTAVIKCQPDWGCAQQLLTAMLLILGFLARPRRRSKHAPRRRSLFFVHRRVPAKTPVKMRTAARRLRSHSSKQSPRARRQGVHAARGLVHSGAQLCGKLETATARLAAKTNRPDQRY